MLLAKIEKLAKQYGLKRLSQESGVSRPHIHKILNGSSSPSLQTITKLLNILGYSLTLSRDSSSQLNLAKDEDLKFAMAYYGAPFVISPDTKESYKKYLIPEIDAVLLQALKRGRFLPEINSVLPFFIHINISSLNLKTLIVSFEDHQYLAYLFNLLSMLTSDARYIRAIVHLKIDTSKLRSKVLIKGAPKNKFLKAYLARKVVNAAADNWRIKTADSFDNIKQRFEKWSSLAIHT